MIQNRKIYKAVPINESVDGCLVTGVKVQGDRHPVQLQSVDSPYNVVSVHEDSLEEVNMVEEIIYLRHQISVDKILQMLVASLGAAQVEVSKLYNISKKEKLCFQGDVYDSAMMRLCDVLFLFQLSGIDANGFFQASVAKHSVDHYNQLLDEGEL